MRRRIALGAGAVIALGAATGAYVLWGRGGSAAAQDPGRGAGTAAAAAIRAAVEAVPVAPHPCARLALAGAPARTFQAGKRSFAVDGDTLKATPVRGDRELVLGVVADARGNQDDTIANVAAARDAFARAGVELVLVTGGMAESADDLAAVVRPLADGSWPVVLIAGDRERADAAAGAGQTLGDTVVDGAAVRFVQADGAVVATLPGVATDWPLVPGADGCARESGDDVALMAAVDERPGVHLLASWAPPRQPGARASDLTRDGVHAGDRGLATALAAGRVALVVHGMVNDGAVTGPTRGSFAVNAAHPHALTAGAIDAVPIERSGKPPVTGAALIVRVGAKRITWQRVRLEGSRPR